MNTIDTSSVNAKPIINGSNFIIKINDIYCEWEYGFTIEKASINDFIEAIEKKFNIKRDYELLLGSSIEINPKNIKPYIMK